MTRLWAHGHVPRGCSAHQMKGLETLICLATKILKIGPKLRELEPWHSKYSKTFNADIISALISSLWLVTLMSGSGYFDCQGHNSLNFGPIFKILVAKHISVSRPFIWCAEHAKGALVVAHEILVSAQGPLVFWFLGLGLKGLGPGLDNI